MTPHSDSNAPTIDHGVEARLKRLDPTLKVTWNRWSVDHRCRPIITSAGADPDPSLPYRQAGPVHDPQWNLWRWDDEYRRWWFVNSYPHFGHQEVWKLERDVARTMAAKDILARHTILRDRARAEGMRKYKERHDDNIVENEARIRDLMFGGRKGYRDTKTFSYAGQGSRASGAERSQIRKSAREDGWSLDRPDGE